MSKKEIKYRDPVVEKVVNKFTSRSDVGFKKYGVTLRDDPGNLFTWLNHLQEELMDGILYIERAKEEFTDGLQEEILEYLKNREVEGEEIL